MPRTVRLAMIVAVVTGALPALASAQGNPVAPLPPAPTQPAPAPAAPDDDGLSTAQQILLLGAAGALLGAIALVIVRDARRRAPVKEAAKEERPARSARERERLQRQRRDRAKAARRQRRRNRTR